MLDFPKRQEFHLLSPLADSELATTLPVLVFLALKVIVLYGTIHYYLNRRKIDY